MRRVAMGLALAAAAGGCGLGLTDERSGGAENLPTAGAGPYGRVPFDFDSPISEPFVVAERFASITDPTAVAVDAGFDLWFGYVHVDDAPGTSQIWYAQLPGLHDLLAVGPEPALVADADWEAGRVARPSVVDLGGGHLVLFYEGGDPNAPAIGRADSTDGGATWQKHANNPVLAGAGNPGVVHLDGDWQLYVERPGPSAIYRADSADGVDWALAEAPVLEPRRGNLAAFDRVLVTDPAPVVRVTTTGRVAYGLFYSGRDRTAETGKVQVGYAGSADTETWERFLGDEPVLIENEAPVRSPTALIGATGGVMFFSEVSAGRGKIAAAVHP